MRRCLLCNRKLAKDDSNFCSMCVETRSMAARFRALRKAQIERDKKTMASYSNWGKKQNI